MLLLDAAKRKAAQQAEYKQMLEGRIEFRFLAKDVSGNRVFCERVFVKYRGGKDDNGEYYLSNASPEGFAPIRSIYRLSEIPPGTEIKN